MTVGQLKKILDVFINQGHARKEVVVAKETFSHPLEDDGALRLPIDKVSLASYGVVDADGFVKFRKNGQEYIRTSVVLYGWGYDPEKKFPHRGVSHWPC